MAAGTGFPTSLDGTETGNSNTLSLESLNAAIHAMQRKIGVDSSTDATSLDKRTTNAGRAEHTVNVAGVLTAGAGAMRWYAPYAATVTAVRASVNTAPTDAALLIDVNKNGVTIFTNQAHRPSIAATEFTATASAVDVTALAAGDYVQVDIDQVGSTVAGSDLSVTIAYSI